MENLREELNEFIIDLEEDVDIQQRYVDYDCNDSYQEKVLNDLKKRLILLKKVIKFLPNEPKTVSNDELAKKVLCSHNQPCEHKIKDKICLLVPGQCCLQQKTD